MTEPAAETCRAGSPGACHANPLAHCAGGRSAFCEIASSAFRRVCGFSATGLKTWRKIGSDTAPVGRVNVFARVFRGLTQPPKTALGRVGLNSDPFGVDRGGRCVDRSGADVTDRRRLTLYSHPCRKLERDVTGKVDMPDADAIGTRRDADPLTVSRAAALKVALVAGLALALANCAGPTPTAKVDPKYGVAPSPLVVSDGSEIPRGGGREMVGRPYTIAGRTFKPRRDENYSNRGLASWYGPGFHGRQTANGEIFDQYAISAAHTTMPLPSYARVTNLENNRSLIVRVNDRGPFHGNRIIDVSKTVAEALGFRHDGVGRVQVDYVGPAHVDGSDDQILVSTLRTDGQLAQLPDFDTRPGGTMLASVEPPAQAGLAGLVQSAARSGQEPEPEVAPQAALASFAEAERTGEAVAVLPPLRTGSGPLAVNSWQERTAPQIRRPSVRSGGGSVLAGLFFTDTQGEAGTLSRDSAFGGLATANQRSLRRTP